MALLPEGEHFSLPPYKHRLLAEGEQECALFYMAPLGPSDENGAAVFVH